MKVMLHLLFVSAILGSPIWAQVNESSASVSIHNPVTTDAEPSLEARLIKMKSLYRQGECSYSDVLAAEAELLQEKLASGTKGADIQKRLKEIYNAQIGLSQERGNREETLVFQIKLLEVTTDTDTRESLLNCYKQLIDYKLEKYNRGACSYVDVLHAEISYLKASLPGQSPEQAKKIEEEILQKQGMIERILTACP